MASLCLVLPHPSANPVAFLVATGELELCLPIVFVLANPCIHVLYHKTKHLRAERLHVYTTMQYAPCLSVSRHGATLKVQHHSVNM